MIRSAHILGLAGLLALVACEAVSFRSGKKTQTQVQRSSADAKADEADCLAIRSGRELNQTEQQRFGSVGLIAILNPDLTTGSLCSAALIRPNVVLTAQHCVSDIPTLAPIPNRQLIFTLETKPVLASNLTLVNPLRRKVTNVIRWEEVTTPPSGFRDVALMILETPFDESIPLFDVRQQEMNVRDPVRMVGFGGYTNGADAASYSVGAKRIGAAFIAGYTNERMAGFPAAETRYVATTDYLLLDPGQGGEIICGGDSGSSLLFEQRGFRSIVGVTSMGYTSGNTIEQQCAGTVQGLFVPSHQIRSWINTKLKTIPNEKELMTYTTLFGRVTALGNNEAGTGLVSVRLKAEEYLDNGLGMATDFEFTAKICSENCPHPTVRQGTLAVNESVVAKVYKVGEEFYLHTIAFDTAAPLSQFKFKGMIESFGSEVTSYGRKLRPVRFAKAQADSSVDKLVFTGERMEALLCTSGCSKSSVIGSSVNLVEGQGVTATVDFVEGSGVYLRNIEVNVAFNRNPPVAPSVAPAPSVVSDDEEDEDDEDGVPRRRRRSSESPCAE